MMYGYGKHGAKAFGKSLSRFGAHMSHEMRESPAHERREHRHRKK